MGSRTDGLEGDKGPRKFLPLRKLAHAGGVVIPFIAVILGRGLAIYLVLFLTLLFLFLEAIKPRLCSGAGFKCFWRKGELKGFAFDPFLYLISIFVLLLLSFLIDEGICYASIVVLTVGDGMSTMVGVRGRLHFRDSRKTVEGAVAGILCSAIIGLYFAGGFAIIGSLAGMLAEVTSKRYDNISVPFSALIAMLFARIFTG